MLFNSYAFIFAYLPVVLIGFFWLARLSHAFAAGWLALASLLFYGYWNPAYIGLLLGSIVCNYAFGLWIAKAGVRREEVRKKRLLVVAIASNLALLAYYKYANFFVGSINDVAGTSWSLGEIMLPLGISFFTFTQIAFLVDTYRGEVKEYNFVHYTLFVTYFPHLIAGPVLHHKEMMPQFAHASTYRFSYENMAVGGTIFIIGLFKKVVVADGIAFYVPTVFDAPASGIQLTFVEAWGGALCYGLQLYFDFSGYSDMAIGLSRMFGVVLPLNFHSPYKSVNIIEFWRRWHMTLSRFLRDYLYIPLGGNRKSKFHRYVNLMTTMLLGGLWHGAGWTFVIWGGLHGLFLMVNHGWQSLRKMLGQNPKAPLSWPMHRLAVLITFLSVTVAWVFFRASDLPTALNIVQVMFGSHGVVLPDNWFTRYPEVHAWLDAHGWFAPSNGLATAGMMNWIWILLLVVWLAPNTQTIMQSFRPALDAPVPAAKTRLEWLPNFWAAALIWGLAFAALINLSQQSTFLYFQF
ncbi:MAG TPA: MBOAT family protein [Gallionella sp.]|nr:MBOAT family protein [Gallionella sp.]